MSAKWPQLAARYQEFQDRGGQIHLPDMVYNHKLSNAIFLLLFVGQWTVACFGSWKIDVHWALPIWGNFSSCLHNLLEEGYRYKPGHSIYGYNHGEGFFELHFCQPGEGIDTTCGCHLMTKFEATLLPHTPHFLLEFKWCFAVTTTASIIRNKLENKTITEGTTGTQHP